jgi:hypothetical protein
VRKLEKHVDACIVLFALALSVLLPTQVVIREANGEGSPVTCVVLTNPSVSAVASNYTVSVDPASAKVIPGETATFGVSVMSKDKEPEIISLDVTGLPEGISAVFDPERGTTNFESKLTISVDEMICPGVYAPSIVARDTNLQLAEFKLEVAGAGSIREALEDEIAELNIKIDELNTKIDDLESKMKNGQFDISGGYLAIILVAIIGSFLLAAFALFVLLRYSKSKNSPAPTPGPSPPQASASNNGKLQEIIFLLRQLIETSRRLPQIIYEPKQKTRSEGEKVVKKEPVTEEPVSEPKVGDVWYAYCQICGLQTEHGRDYQGEFCARCGNRST